MSCQSVLFVCFEHFSPLLQVIIYLWRCETLSLDLHLIATEIILLASSELIILPTFKSLDSDSLRLIKYAAYQSII